MKKRIPVLVLSAFLTVGAARASDTGAANCSDYGKFGEISLGDLTAKIESKSVFVIDVNGPDSFKKRHIPTAIHFAASEKKLGDMLPKEKDKLIVAYCGGPQCTAWQKAAKAACEMGYTNIQHFKGGIKGWPEAPKS